MSIACPHCGHSIEFRDAKPGRFRIRCPQCRGPAALTVEQDGDGFRLGIAALSDEKKAEPASVPPREPKPLPDRVARKFGPFRLEGLLGQGSLGDVYLARRGKFGPRVALKVLRPRFSSDAAFVAAFNREAYAAAQIEHPQIAPIVGFGEAAGLYWVASEYVEGTPLSDLRGKIDPDRARGYVLQAARGLKFANDQGMVHRGIHADNLILDAQGVVRITDLGLTNVREPGKPGFTASEVDATPERVDGRADIYSLGWVLFTLVTGREPGEPGAEPPPVALERLPGTLSALIQKMTAERPSDRYASLTDLVLALEKARGLTPVAFSPTDEQIAAIETASNEFQAGPYAQWGPWGLFGFNAACLLFASLFLLAMQPVACATILGLWLTTIAVLVGIRGYYEGSEFLDKGRALLLTNRPADWAAVGLGLAVLLALVVVFLGIPLGIFLAIVAAGFAAGYYFGVDRPLSLQRIEPESKAAALIAELRAKGVSEDDLRRFVCTFAGRNWEEFYERLFGYDSKRLARDLWGRGPGGKPRPKFGIARDPIADWMDRTIQGRAAASDRLRIQAIEEAGNVAQGTNLLTARRRARKTADAMVLAAAEIRASSRAARRDPDAIVVTPRPISDVIREAASKPDLVLKVINYQDDGPSIVETALEVVFGPRSRFILGAILVGLCLAWAHQNAVFSAEEIRRQVQVAVESQDINAVGKVKIDYDKRDTAPLRLPMVPDVITGRFNSWGPGASGLFLIVSAFVPGVRIAAFALPAAVVPFLGGLLPIPKIGPLDGTSAAAAVGAGVLVIGLLFGRSRR